MAAEEKLLQRCVCFARGVSAVAEAQARDERESVSQSVRWLRRAARRGPMDARRASWRRRGLGSRSVMPRLGRPARGRRTWSRSSRRRADPICQRGAPRKGVGRALALVKEAAPRRAHWASAPLGRARGRGASARSASEFRPAAGSAKGRKEVVLRPGARLALAGLQGAAARGCLAVVAALAQCSSVAAGCSGAALLDRGAESSAVRSENGGPAGCREDVIFRWVAGPEVTAALSAAAASAPAGAPFRTPVGYAARLAARASAARAAAASSQKLARRHLAERGRLAALQALRVGDVGRVAELSKRAGGSDSAVVSSLLRRALECAERGAGFAKLTEARGATARSLAGVEGRARCGEAEQRVLEAAASAELRHWSRGGGSEKSEGCDASVQMAQRRQLLSEALGDRAEKDPAEVKQAIAEVRRFLGVGARQLRRRDRNSRDCGWVRRVASAAARQLQSRAQRNAICARGPSGVRPCRIPVAASGEGAI